MVNSVTSNLRIFVVEFNYCGQQFPGKSLTTSQYVANKKTKFKASWEKSLVETYSSTFIPFILNMNLLYYWYFFFFALNFLVTLHVI